MKLFKKHKGFVSLLVLGTIAAAAALLLLGAVLGTAVIGGSGIGLVMLRITTRLRNLDQEQIDLREV